MREWKSAGGKRGKYAVLEVEQESANGGRGIARSNSEGKRMEEEVPVA